MPLFGRRQPDIPGQLSEADRDVIRGLAAEQLGDLVPSATALRDPDVAARVDLPDLMNHVGAYVRANWPMVVAAYYAKNLKSVRDGAELEKRAARLEDARPYFTAILEAGDPPRPVGLAVKGLLPGTRYALCLQDGDVVRMLLPAMLAAWGVTAEDVLEAGRDRARVAPVNRSKLGSRPSVTVLDTEPGLWSALVIETLADIDPDAVGPFGTLAVISSPKFALVRPLVFGPDLRADVVALAVAHDAYVREHPGTIHRNLLWRRVTGEVVEIDMSLTETPSGRKLNVADPRFRGVLTAIEPLASLPVPDWAAELMTPEEYTRFAGTVAAFMKPGGGAPDEIARITTELPVAAMARICSTVDLEDWPRVVGFWRRIGVRTAHGPRRDLDGAMPRSFIVERGGNLPSGIGSLIADLPEVEKAGIYCDIAVRAGNRPPPPDWQMSSPREIDFIVLIAHRGDAAMAHDIDMLQAACAVFMPLGVFTAIEPTTSDDPRFADEAHLLRLR